MSLPLPLMNNLCKRWTLPIHIIQNCDFYFLRNMEDSEFVQRLEVEEENGETYFFIQEYATNFRVIFQHDALEVYRKNGELDKRNEPNNTRYWLSFRSITFVHAKKECTKSYVLVQVDKGQKELEKIRGQVPERSGAPLVRESETKESLKIFNPKQVKLFNSFAKNSFVEKSQPSEREEDNENESNGFHEEV